MMYFTSNESLASLLFDQVENPNPKVGSNVSMSLFVQLFSYSIPYPDLSMLVGGRPIFDSTICLESLRTHVLAEHMQVHSAHSHGVVQRIFSYAVEMMKMVAAKECSRDQQDATPSEINLDFALCAMVNISLSHRLCRQNRSFRDAYRHMSPCMHCQLNSYTIAFLRSLLPLKDQMPKVKLHGNFDTHLAVLISDWWYRVEHPNHCLCNVVCSSADAAASPDHLRTLKRAASEGRLDILESLPDTLRSRLQAVPLSPSPVGSPKTLLLNFEDWDIGSPALMSGLVTPPTNPNPHYVSFISSSSSSACRQQWSRNHIFPSEDRTSKSAVATLPMEAPKARFTKCQALISRIRGRIGLTGSDTESDE